MVADKGKKQKVAEKTEEEIAEQMDTIVKLQEIQDELEKINEEASDKVLEVEQKYNEVRKPVYNKRNELINLIPNFWLTAFVSHPALSTLLNEEDEKIFKYLDSLEVVDSKDVKSGYSITFNFNVNPYFEDRKLTKSYTFNDDETVKITSTSIKWKEGKGIPNGTQEKKGNKRILYDESFFAWFDQNVQKEMEDVLDEIAEVIKEDLWPNPLTYFDNDPDEDDDGDEGDEGSDDDDNDDDEDDN